jgi:hypothetical protein
MTHDLVQMTPTPSGGGMVITEGAAEAFRADTQIERAAEDGQMAQQMGLIETMWLTDEPSAAMAPRAGQSALDGQDELTGSGEIGLQDTHILLKIERSRAPKAVGCMRVLCGI